MFVTLSLEIQEKTKLHPWKFHKTCYTHWKFQGQKQRPMEIQLNFFLITPGNSTFFLLGPWDCYMVLLQYPWKFHALNHPAWIFVWSSPFIILLLKKNLTNDCSEISKIRMNFWMVYTINMKWLEKVERWMYFASLTKIIRDLYQSSDIIVDHSRRFKGI